MGLDLLRRLTVFIGLCLAQTLVLNHIHLFGCATPLLYIYGGAVSTQLSPLGNVVVELSFRPIYRHIFKYARCCSHSNDHNSLSTTLLTYSIPSTGNSCRAKTRNDLDGYGTLLLFHRADSIRILYLAFQHRSLQLFQLAAMDRKHRRQYGSHRITYFGDRECQAVIAPKRVITDERLRIR